MILRYFSWTASCRKTSLLLIFSVFSLNLASQEININENGIENRAEIELDKQPNDPFFNSAKRARKFRVNSSLLTRNLQKGQKIKLELFENKSFNSSVINKTTDINGVTTFTLKLDEFQYSFGYISISPKSHLMTLDIPEKNERYITRKSKKGETFLFLLDPEKIKDGEDCKPPKIIQKKLSPSEESGNIQGFHDASYSESYATSFCNPLDGSEQTVIDIMVVYTPEAGNWAGIEGGINNTISTAVASANTVAANSNLGIIFNLVYSGPVNYTEETSDSSVHLEDLHRENDGKMDEVHEIRKNVGADMVSILTYSGNVGGMAYLLNNRYGEITSPFSLTRVGSASQGSIFAHELGHNLGAMHHSSQNFQAGPTPWNNWENNTWSAGWRWLSEDGLMYSSIMSYASGSYYDDGYSSTRIPYFSDSNQLYLGAKMGDDLKGDNVKTLLETKKAVANYSNSLAYCKASGDNQEAASIDKVIFGQVENSSGKNAYADYSNIATCIFPQESIDLEVFVSGISESKEILVWIDWNDDEVFAATELIYQSTGNLSQYSTNITIPSNVNPGIKRLRIRLHDSKAGANSSPCGISNVGEVEDYSINILPGAECTVASTPQNIQIKNIQNNSIEILWDSVVEAAAYELRYKKVESPNWNSIGEVFYNSYVLKDLLASTEYEFQVRSKCNAQNTSEYSQTMRVTTRAALDQLEFIEIILDGESGWPISPVTININDVNGNVSNFNSKVSLSLVDIDQTGGQLKGYLIRNAENGSATFDGLIIDKPGTYKLEASIEGLPPFQSNSFEILTTGPGDFVVNTIEDTPDANLYDFICEDINGKCSLRAAIENANKTLAKDRISFNISGEGPQQINLENILPQIISPVDIDGTTQTEYSFNNPQIVISGENIPLTVKTASGIILGKGSSNSRIRGLVIGKFGKESDTTYQGGIGILITSSTNNIIQSNFIGIGADGKTSLPNIWGLVVGRGTGVDGNNLIGGPTPEHRNIISGNQQAGIEIGYTVFGNIIQGNYIGTNVDGTMAVPNGTGILGRETNIYDGNLISGNDIGLYIEQDENLVINNFIGTDFSGKNIISNTTGIIVKGQNNQIGLPGAGNVISGNFNDGIYIGGGSYNILQANRIGTDINGIYSLPNFNGIITGGGTNNYFGGLTKESENIISGNSNFGIYIANSNLNEVYGNLIGVANDAVSALPNGSAGIYVSGKNNQIGDINEGFANTIAMNSRGVSVAGVENNISGNVMFGNTQGIDLGNDNRVDRNDRGDSDMGANRLQNYPDLSKASSNGGLLEISYILDSDPNYSDYPINVEIFKSDGNAQGMAYLGSFSVDEYRELKGNNTLIAQVELKSSSNLADGDLIVATATDAAGNTSEFSNEVSVIITGSCTPVIWYADADNDGLGDLDISVYKCVAPEGYVSNSDDCDDTDPKIGALQIWYADSDGDGFGDATTSIEECTQPTGYVQDNTDCDDSDNTVYPGAVDDTVDGIDQNCDDVDGPVTSCTGSDLITVSEVCSTATSVIWEITNPGSCHVDGRWELRKSSSTGDSSGTFSLVAGEAIQITSGVVSKGKTQIVLYWNDSAGTELNTSTNASGITCSGSQSSMASSPETELFVSPNPVTEGGIGIFFTAVNTDSILNAVVYNSSGQLMASESFSIKSGTTSLIWDLDHSSWIEGVYILNVTINNETYQAQFIK